MRALRLSALAVVLVAHALIVAGVGTRTRENADNAQKWHWRKKGTLLPEFETRTEIYSEEPKEKVAHAFCLRRLLACVRDVCTNCCGHRPYRPPTTPAAQKMAARQ